MEAAEEPASNVISLRPVISKQAFTSSSNPIERQSLLSLPNELLLQISGNLDRKSLGNLRLANKFLDRIAVQSLFATHVLSLCEHSLVRCLNVIASQELCSYVHSLVLDTKLAVRDLSDLCEHGREQFLLDCPRNGHLTPWYMPLTKFISKEFPMLNSIHLLFGNASIWPDDIMDEEEVITELHMFRTQYLIDFVEALFKRTKNKDLSPLKSLTISNFSSYPQKVLTDHGGFKDAIDQLRELHVLLGPRGQSFFRERPHMPYEAMEFSELRNIWIQPIQEKLTSLTIYQQDLWGAIPYIRMPPLPELKYLALGRFTFAYRNQFEWVMSLLNLETLILDDCTMIWLLAIGTDERIHLQIKPIRLSPLSPHPKAKADMIVYENPLQWSNLFGVIKKNLTKLRSMSFGAGHWDTTCCPHRDEAFLQRHGLKNEVLSRRYVVFDGLHDLGDGEIGALEVSDTDIAFCRPDTDTFTFEFFHLDAVISPKAFKSIRGMGKGETAKVRMSNKTDAKDKEAFQELTDSIRDRFLKI